MKNIKIFVIMAFVALLSSCKDNKVAFGSVGYYPSFLWVESKTVPVEKTLDFDFSQDAKYDHNSYAEFQFVDNADKPIGTDVMQVYLDGTQLKDNKFKVYSNVTSKKLKFTFSPDVESGKYQGYLRLVGHNLDRLDSEQLSPGKKIDAFQWTLNYDKSMNPLAKVLMWIGIVMLVSLVIWIFILRSIFFPKFRAINKIVVIPNQTPVNIRFKGARMVVLDKVLHKQSAWNRFWTGKIIYKQNIAITTPITFKPRNKGRNILFVAKSANYICMPNPISMQPSKVSDLINNQQITIQ